MPRLQDLALRETGTRFQLFPQPPYLEGFHTPETVWISSLPGTIGPGPAGPRMYTVDAIGKHVPYGFPYLPPYRGPAYPPILPDPNGNFDYFAPESREFQVAHMYGTLHRVLDIWEGYLETPIEWHFRDQFRRLELIPILHWDNAHAGFGFIETGFDTTAQGAVRPHCLNFDVLAHELGHILLYSVVGIFRPGTLTAQYKGFHEAMADLVALVSVLHFDSVADLLLRRTSGNLYTLNALNRIGELSGTEQIRVASNRRRMSEFEAGWRKPHDLSQPLTGALFDVFVDVFHARLLELGLIPESLANTTYEVPASQLHGDWVQARYTAAYRGNHAGFMDALLEARDHLGACLARAWQRLSPDNLSYVDLQQAFATADLELTGGRYQREIRQSFAWREIGAVEIGPQLPPAPNGTAVRVAEGHHALSLAPEDASCR